MRNRISIYSMFFFPFLYGGGLSKRGVMMAKKENLFHMCSHHASHTCIHTYTVCRFPLKAVVRFGSFTMLRFISNEWDTAFVIHWTQLLNCFVTLSGWIDWEQSEEKEREREKLEEPNKRMNRCNSTRVCFLSSPIFLSPFFLIVNLIRFLTSLVLSIPISLDSDAICCCSPHSSNANRCLTLTTIHNWIETCSVHRATNINICIMHKLCCCCWFCCFQLLFMPFCE